MTLSWRDIDEEGKETGRSPFLDEIRDLLEPEPDDGNEEDDLLERIAKARHLGDVVMDTDVAVGETQLARSLAARGRSEVEPTLARISTFGTTGEAVSERLELAETVTSPERLQPRGLEGPAADFAGDIEEFSASTLESFWECPYRWFVQRQLAPNRIEPPSTPLTIGSLVHDVLAALFESHLAEKDESKRRPELETAETWKREMREILDDKIEEFADRGDLVGSDPMFEVEKVRIVRGLEQLIDGEARRTDAYYPSRFEYSFSIPEEAEDEGVIGPGLVFKGVVDRIDEAEGEGGPWGVIRDYKYSSGGSIIKQESFEEKGKLQLPLYLRAVERALGIKPVGAVYQAAKAVADKDSPTRGMIRKPPTDEDEPKFPEPPKGTGRDVMESRDFDQLIDDAVARSELLAENLRSGAVDRMPIGGSCPSYCDFQSICRREPAAGDGGSSEENGG